MMAEGIVAVDGTNLMDIVKGLISKVAVEILTKRGLYDSRHNLKVFCSKTSGHGELLIRKEFLMSVVKESCNKQQLKVITDDIARDMNKLVTTSAELSCYFAEVMHSSLGHINITLCRPHFFAVCIGEVVKSRNDYGTLSSTGEQVYLFSHDLIHGVTTAGEYCTELHQLLNLPVARARGVLMASLLRNLLTAAGLTVTLCSRSQYSEALFKSLFSSPKHLPYICEQSALGIHCIDVNKYLLERNLIGRGGFSSDLNKVTGHIINKLLLCLLTVRDEMGVTQIGHKALDIIKAIPDSHDTTVVHIVHYQGSHDVERAITVSLVARGTNVQHQILTHAGVKGDDEIELVFSQLLRNRELSSMEACRVKYTNSDIAHMKGISSRVAEAAIKFNLLSVDPKCKVKCCLYGNVDLRSSGSFVLYNYARIATIMDKFEDAIRKGTYSPLPHVSNIDYSLLTDQSEWVLLFQYVATYPSMVREASTLEKRGLGLYVTSGSNKLCIFLIHLAREFSSYYGRVKILLEPQPHLLPLMYARLTLVSCIKQVLYNGLKLLSIEPINQL